MRNKYGETALFRAARYGKMKMFMFLDDEMNSAFTSEGEEEERKAFYQKNDKAAILHASILTGHFGVRTGDTPASTEGEVRRKKQRCESAVRLAKFLIESDTSWEVTEPAVDQSKPKIHKHGMASITSHGKETGEGPKTPAAIEHIDDEWRNILHVAIKYRQIYIFDFVEKLKTPMMRLIKKIDNNGNSIPHMVGIKEDDYVDKDMRSPALLLQRQQWELHTAYGWDKGR
ncbi:hypothetical protein Acr_08g0001150 [Actinidia rufa]|uniref:Ankyrin repeat family protein n=1 Tax=Actinidia rufa TaxID=165716 RepID=A0A7J0F0K4_9ERIC|nr:hypothetical protein Acr_08g0001150 [Actinidia rufa]